MQIYVGLRSQHAVCRLCGFKRSEHTPRKSKDKRLSPLCPQGIGLSKPEPSPKKNEGVAVYDLLYEDIRMSIERSALSLIEPDFRDRDRGGEEKYGTRLGLDDGRDPLKDPYQEAMDLCVYLRKYIAIEQRYGRNPVKAHRLYSESIRLVIGIRHLIFERDGK